MAFKNCGSSLFLEIIFVFPHFSCSVNINVTFGFLFYFLKDLNKAVDFIFNLTKNSFFTCLLIHKVTAKFCVDVRHSATGLSPLLLGAVRHFAYKQQTKFFWTILENIVKTGRFGFFSLWVKFSLFWFLLLGAKTQMFHHKKRTSNICLWGNSLGSARTADIFPFALGLYVTPLDIYRSLWFKYAKNTLHTVH